jgi:hypothetical protein
MPPALGYLERIRRRSAIGSGREHHDLDTAGYPRKYLSAARFVGSWLLSDRFANHERTIGGDSGDELRGAVGSRAAVIPWAERQATKRRRRSYPAAMSTTGDAAAAALAATFQVLVAAIPEGWVDRTDGVLAGVTGVPIPSLNGVWTESLTCSEATVGSYLDTIAKTGFPYGLQVRPGSGGTPRDWRPNEAWFARKTPR